MKIEQKIHEKLTCQFSPSFLEVFNESFRHAVPKDSETHFKIVIVSNAFQGAKLVERHRMIYKCLEDELNSSVHALALHSYTPHEWEKAGERDLSSPPCSKH